jgi:hypothetical protein
LVSLSIGFFLSLPIVSEREKLNPYLPCRGESFNREGEDGANETLELPRNSRRKKDRQKMKQNSLTSLPDLVTYGSA